MKLHLHTALSLILFFLGTNVYSATYYSIQNGPWTSSSTWSLTSGGPAIPSGYPGSGDNVIIEGGFTVTIAASGVENLSAANVFIGGSNTSGTLSYPNWNANSTLTITGDLTIGGSNVSATGTLNYGTWGFFITCSRLLKGTGAANRINALQQDFIFTGTFTLPASFNEFRNFIIDGGTVTLSGNIETNGSTSPTIAAGSTLDMQTYSMEIGGYGNFNINGTLIVGGNSGGFGTSNFPNTFENLAIGNNSTVVYSYAGNQTIYPAAYNNLTLTGSGTKTTGSLGFVSGVTITNGGSGYDCDAELNFSGGGGSGASGEAYSSGDDPYSISSASVHNGGSGYTSAPSVTISGYCGGSGATATANVTIVTSATINGKITRGGAVTVSGPAFVYGSGATLEYSGIVAQNTGIEFPSTWSGSGGVIINNSNGVVLNAAKTISSSISFTNGILTTSGTNSLTISNTSAAAITGGSASSFIDGPVTITLPAGLAPGAVYTLPVGKSSYYSPMSLNNPATGAGTITVTAEAFRNSMNGSEGAGILSIHKWEYWSLATTGNFTGSSVSLTRSTALGAINLIGYSNTLNGVYNTLGGTVSGTSIINSNNIGASAQTFFVFGSDNAVLPLKMSAVLAFEGRDGIELNWTTYEEINIREFEIEKSRDGQHFYRAGNLFARGNAHITTAYKWVDENIITGNNYYRIKSIGADDEVLYSEVVRVVVGKGSGIINIYPNPLKGSDIHLGLVNREKGTYEVVLSNSSGQLIFSKKVIHSGGSATYIILPGKNLSRGIYHLKIKNSKFLETRSILKN